MRKHIDGAPAALALLGLGDQLGRSALTQSVFHQDLDSPALDREPGIDLGDMVLTRLSRADYTCAGLDDAENMLVLLFVRAGGCRVVQGGQVLTLGPTEAAFLDGRAPYSCDMTDSDGYLLTLWRLDHRVMTPGRGCGLPSKIPAGDAGLQLIATYLQSDLIYTETTPAAVSIIASHLRDLVTLSLHAALAIKTTRPSIHVIKRDIRANLTRHALSAEVVAQWYGLSLRALQRIFARSGGTISSFILDERLQLARQRLERASHDHRIDMIARECGFHSLSHFNMAFRRKFGAAPSTIRAGSRINQA